MVDEPLRRSRWMMRAMEWDDARARYPNMWKQGMPCQVLALDRVASRLRLGDLVAVFYPSSVRHAERSRSFLGLSRVVGLRRSHEDGAAWIDLDTAHRFDPPLQLDEQPRRVFMCCDPGWPGADVALFRRVFDAAVAAGWQPLPEEQGDAAPEIKVREAPPAVSATVAPAEAKTTESLSAPVAPEADPAAAAEPSTAGGRHFGGVDYSGDMRDQRQGTWLAVVELVGERLRVNRLEATGRSGLQRYLRDADVALSNVEAIGMDFPFGLPLPFAETLLGGGFPKEGWWALAKRFERLTRPQYLIALQEFRDAEGEPRRLTDERAEAASPLHRVGRDLGPMAFHGIRMIAEDRSRFAVRPFESAQGRLLLEVCPTTAIKRLPEPSGKLRAVLAALATLDRYPVEVGERFTGTCCGSRGALHAVVAARCAAIAVLSGETDRSPDDLADGAGDRLRHEGWIYGLGEPPAMAGSSPPGS